MKKTQILKVILAALITASTLSACDEKLENTTPDDDFVKIDTDSTEVVGLIPEENENEEYNSEDDDTCDTTDPEDIVLMGDVAYLPEDEETDDADDNFVREDPVINDDEEELATVGRIIYDGEYPEALEGMISVED